VKAYRSLLAHLRGGTAPLQVEIGRYVTFLWKKEHVRHVIQAWWRMRSTSVWVAQA